MATEQKKGFTQADIMTLLDTLYQKVLAGVPKVSVPVSAMALDYMSKHSTKEVAAKAMLKNQVIKCATSGFLTGFGGIVTLPVAIPANISSVLYVQMRMIACTAYMAGYDLHSDQVQTFVYACLAGVSVNLLVKRFGIKFGVKIAEGLAKKIPGRVLTAINQKVGFRLLTKMGSKGLINIGKLVPGVGAFIGGGLDYAETKIIAARAYKWFIEGDFSDNRESAPLDTIEVDFTVNNSPQDTDTKENTSEKEQVHT